MAVMLGMLALRHGRPDFGTAPAGMFDDGLEVVMNESSDCRWSDRCKCGHAGMDTTHAEFVALIDELRSCADEEVAGLLNALAVHCRLHFEEEHALMDRHEFPASECHKAEHAAVLASIHEVLGLADALQQAAISRRLAQSLWPWFEGHLTHLDSALAHWVVKRTVGGAPIVVRRGLLPTRPTA